MAIINKHQAFLPPSHELANNFGMDVLRLAPQLERPTPHTLYEGTYFRSVGDLDFAIIAFVIDNFVDIPRDAALPHYSLGMSALLLDALEDGEMSYDFDAPSRVIETLLVEGGIFEDQVARRLDPQLKPSRNQLSLRFEASMGGDPSVIDTTAPGFEPRLAANALIRSFYSHYRIDELSIRDRWHPNQPNPKPSDEPAIDAIDDGEYELTDDDAPDDIGPEFIS